jgi:hypothetical protein
MAASSRAIILDQLDDYNQTDLLSYLISTQAMTSLNENHMGSSQINHTKSCSVTMQHSGTGLDIHILTNSFHGVPPS